MDFDSHPDFQIRERKKEKKKKSVSISTIFWRGKKEGSQKIIVNNFNIFFKILFLNLNNDKEKKKEG